MRFRPKIVLFAVVCGFLLINAANACDKALSEEYLQVCSQDLEWLVRYAASLNVKKRYAEAADLLERVLMEHPNVSGAVEQYNQALAGIDSQNIGYRQELPVLQDIPSQQWQIHGGLQVRGGYSSNLNQAPSRSTVQLTISQTENLELFVPQFQKQAGFGVETQLAGSATRALGDKFQWQMRGELFNRETGYTGYADYQGAALQSSLMRQGDNGTETGAALGLNALRYGNNIYLYTFQMMLRHAGSKGAYCKPQMGMDVLWQRQHENPLLDSRYAGIMGGALCDTEIGFYNAAISAGWDWASSQRPGGDQQRVKLEVTGIWATDVLLQNSFIKARADLALSYDMQAYSPFLNNNATRHIDKTTLSLDYDWPLKWVGDNWRGVAGARWQNQNSNIGLFETDAVEGWLGVRTAW